MAKSDTQVIRLQTDPRAAFDFIADPKNLPVWAVGFCRGIRQDGDMWIVRTAGGECPLEVEADDRRGTIDFHMRLAPGVKGECVLARYRVRRWMRLRVYAIRRTINA